MLQESKRVMLNLVCHFGRGYGKKTDNFFTSLQLLPAPYKKLNSSRFAFKKNRPLVSYVPKKNAAIILLAGEHTDDKICREEFCHQPEIILRYNTIKGIVDTTEIG